LKLITIEQQTRAQVAAFLPRAISKVLESYHSFMKGDVFGEKSNPDTQDFSDAHKAAKVAISHIELLIKLAKWADLPDATQGDDPEFRKLMERAEGDVAEFKAKMKDDDDDDDEEK